VLSICIHYRSKLIFVSWQGVNCCKLFAGDISAEELFRMFFGDAFTPGIDVHFTWQNLALIFCCQIFIRISEAKCELITYVPILTNLAVLFNVRLQLFLILLVENQHKGSVITFLSSSDCGWRNNETSGWFSVVGTVFWRHLAWKPCLIISQKFTFWKLKQSWSKCSKARNDWAKTDCLNVYCVRYARSLLIIKIMSLCGPIKGKS